MGCPNTLSTQKPALSSDVQTDGDVDGAVDTGDRGGYSACVVMGKRGNLFLVAVRLGHILARLAAPPLTSSLFVFGSEVDEFGRGALTLRFSRPVSACHRLPRRGLKSSVSYGFWHYSAA